MKWAMTCVLKEVGDGLFTMNAGREFQVGTILIKKCDLCDKVLT